MCFCPTLYFFLKKETQNKKNCFHPPDAPEDPLCNIAPPLDQRAHPTAENTSGVFPKHLPGTQSGLPVRQVSLAQFMQGGPQIRAARCQVCHTQEAATLRSLVLWELKLEPGLIYNIGIYIFSRLRYGLKISDSKQVTHTKHLLCPGLDM